MNRGDFLTWLNGHFRDVSDAVLSDLKPGEDLTINLDAEDTLYVRFNGNKVRQNTDVEQMVLSLRLQADGRLVEKSRTLGGDSAVDKAAVSALLAAARAEIRVLPQDPHLVDVRDNGRSRDEFRGRLLGASDLIETVTATAAGSDLAGLYCGGAVVSATRNSKGQDHWFGTETFFLDYSLYDGPNAAKSVIAGGTWNPQAWDANLARTRNQLTLLGRPAVDVKPGVHRTYLAPGAVSELASMFSWGALSASAWKQGRCALKKLIDREKTLSPLLTVRENFGLGLAPRFNGLGEVSSETVTLIENGRLKELLTSSRSAKEYGLTANGAAESEGLRSLEILPGSLEENDVLRELGTGLYLSNLHYLNWSDPVSARITGMTRYACFWVDNGEIVGPIKDLRFDESLYEALGSKLAALTTGAEIDPSVSTYSARSLGGRRIPGALIDGFTFTL